MQAKPLVKTVPAELVKTIKAEHAACKDAYGAALEHAHKCGRALIDAKQYVNQISTRCSKRSPVVN